MSHAAKHILEVPYSGEPMRSFIEGTMFPVSRLSKESYKERKANSSQTLTTLGKWWGRKPLVLVRALLLGALMPASKDVKKDLAIFLKIMTMDDEGLMLRKYKNLGPGKVFENLSSVERKKFFDATSNSQKATYLKTLSKKDREDAETLAFSRLSYDEKLDYCRRPEQIEGPASTAWKEINSHLGTTAQNLQDLFEQLGTKRFGHRVRVGDAFCGGGSIPYEAARLGCDAFASDLNPFAGLLTWGAFNLLGGKDSAKKSLAKIQEITHKKVNEQISAWKIEHNRQGWRADAYLYCAEAICPSTGYLLPLAPSWVISEKTNVCGVLKKNSKLKRYDIEIVSNADKATMDRARKGTIRDSRMVCAGFPESVPV